MLMLKNAFEHQINMKEEEKYQITCQKKKKEKKKALMKDEKGGKIITKYAAKDPKSYSYSV